MTPFLLQCRLMCIYDINAVPRQASWNKEAYKVFWLGDVGQFHAARRTRVPQVMPSRFPSSLPCKVAAPPSLIPLNYMMIKPILHSESLSSVVETT